MNDENAQAQHETLPGITEGEIVVIRSPRRKRHSSAYRQGGRIVVSIPARMSKAEEKRTVSELISRVRKMEENPRNGEGALRARVHDLIARYAPELPTDGITVSWRAMKERWGSCTGVDRTIRISDRLKEAPDYVLDFVLFHEAIHLLHDDHGEWFKEKMARFPDERAAQAYLDGYEAAESALIPPKIPHLP